MGHPRGSLVVVLIIFFNQLLLYGKGNALFAVAELFGIQQPTDSTDSPLPPEVLIDVGPLAEETSTSCLIGLLFQLFLHIEIFYGVLTLL
jgi:hypothetical protein